MGLSPGFILSYLVNSLRKLVVWLTPISFLGILSFSISAQQVFYRILLWISLALGWQAVEFGVLHLSARKQPLTKTLLCYAVMLFGLLLSMAALTSIRSLESSQFFYVLLLSLSLIGLSEWGRRKSAKLFALLMSIFSAVSLISIGFLFISGWWTPVYLVIASIVSLTLVSRDLYLASSSLEEKWRVACLRGAAFSLYLAPVVLSVLGYLGILPRQFVLSVLLVTVLYPSVTALSEAEKGRELADSAKRDINGMPALLLVVVALLGLI